MMKTTQNQPANDQQLCSNGNTRKRHGSMSMLFAFLLGAGSIVGVTQLAHAHGPFGSPDGAIDKEAMAEMGFAGPGRQSDGERSGRGQKFFKAMGEKRMARLLNKIDATDQQREQIQSALAGLKNKVEPLRAARKAQRQAIQALITAEQLDSNRIEQQRQAMMTLADQMSKQVIAAMTEVNQLLEPDQRKQLAQMMQKKFH